jgi:hypothetical protein
MLFSQRLVELIERNADELAKRWLDEVRRRPETPTFHSFDPDELFERAQRVYSQLGRWISQETTKQEIESYYVELGRQRRREGFSLSEVIMALTITRRYIWIKVLSDGLLDTALELHQALDLNNRVLLYFDRAIFFATKGFETAE